MEIIGRNPLNYSHLFQKEEKAQIYIIRSNLHLAMYVCVYIKSIKRIWCTSALVLCLIQLKYNDWLNVIKIKVIKKWNEQKKIKKKK